VQKEKIKLLFIGSHPLPEKQLAITEEIQQIQNRIRNTGAGEAFEIRPNPSASVDNLLDELNGSMPEIVHFSTHGTELSELLLKSTSGTVAISRSPLVALFKAAPPSIKLLVLNACYSKPLAEALNEYIPCVIGFPATIPDAAAVKFSAQFYSTLAFGQPVSSAFEQAKVQLIVASVQDDSLPGLHSKTPASEMVFVLRRPLSKRKRIRPGWPSNAPVVESAPEPEANLSVAGAAPAPVNLSTWSVAAARAADKVALFERDSSRFGVSAFGFVVEKICHNNGASSIFFRIRGLRTHGADLSSIEFRISVTAGSVGDPQLDADGTALKIDVQRQTSSRPASDLRDVVEEARSLRCVFKFHRPLKSKDSPITFGWTIEIVNCDALTDWEFGALYKNDSPAHMDGSRFHVPREYFARVIWFPVRRLDLRIKLPKSIQLEPFLRTFVRDGPELPGDAVLSEGTLRTYPAAGETWRTDPRATEIEQEFLQPAGDGVWEFSIDYPPVGSCYSLDWILPAPPMTSSFKSLIAQSEQIRSRLLIHRDRRFRDKLDESSRTIHRLFSGLARGIGQKYGSRRKDRFAVTLMTFDSDTKQLVMVEGLRNNGSELDPAAWSFWLPFGMGLAGACFRDGNSAILYQRPKTEGGRRAEYYLAAPGYPQYEFLLALPIDHPDFGVSDEAGTAPHPERCRQLIGVITIGSTDPTSKLKVFCAPKLTPSRYREFARLRDLCQEACDEISKTCYDEDAWRT